jgi:hypothetical protein
MVQQARSVEVIEKLGEVCEELLKQYLCINKQLSIKIILFKSSESERCHTPFQVCVKKYEGVDYQVAIHI